MMESILTVKDLTVRINNNFLINNVSFSIGEGEAVLLSGENGIGKSTLLKALLGLESAGKRISGNIIVRGIGDILTLKPEELQRYRASVAYVPQRDDYSTMGNVRVRDIISDSRMAFSGETMNDAEVNSLIDEWIPRRADRSRVFDAKTKPSKFSGGEQRLLSVLSIISTRSKANLCSALRRGNRQWHRSKGQLLLPPKRRDRSAPKAQSSTVVRGTPQAACGVLPHS